MSSLAVLLAPLLVGTLADASTIKAALAVVPLLLLLAAAGLVVVVRSSNPAPIAVSTH